MGMRARRGRAQRRALPRKELAMMKWKSLLAMMGMLGTLVLAVPTAVRAQDGEVNSYIELLRSDIKTQKKEIITSLVHLTEAQSAPFWTLYNEYQLALDKVSDERIANIKDFAANYDKMTDAKALELTKKAMDFQSKRLGVHKSYVGKFQKLIGPVESAKLMQLEGVIQSLLDLQVQANLPLIEKTATAEPAKN
jgi:hypothetical protein